MAWKVIRQTGSLCLMMLFLATGALAQSTTLKEDVIEAFTKAAFDPSFTSITEQDLPLLEAEVNAVNEGDTTANDAAIWNIYAREFSLDQFELPAAGFAYCVVSRTGQTADNNNHTCNSH